MSDENDREPLWGARRMPDPDPAPEREHEGIEPWRTDPAGTKPRVNKSVLVPSTPARPTLTSDDATPRDGGGGEGHDFGAAALADDDRHEPPFAARFQFLLGVLLAVGLIAVGLLAYGLKTNTGDTGNAKWSPWQPSSDGIEGAQQIADHVGPQYRLSTGEQIVLLEGGELEVAELPTTIAMRDNEGDLSLMEGDGVLYTMCGLGPKCAIATGKPSVERKALLQREALELALYSFRYLDDIDQVVVLLPPPKGADPSDALFFRRGDLEQQLRSQLRTTLPAPAPSVKDVEKSPDWPTVERITSHGLFSFSYAQAQDSGVYLVLEPHGTAAPQTSSLGGATTPTIRVKPAPPEKQPGKKKGK